MDSASMGYFGVVLGCTKIPVPLGSVLVTVCDGHTQIFRRLDYLIILYIWFYKIISQSK